MIADVGYGLQPWRILLDANVLNRTFRKAVKGWSSRSGAL
jgi:hypothetical protein